jgi:lantibiotic transport system permease protein
MSLPLASPSFARQLSRCLAADYLKLRRTPALGLAVAGGALPVLLEFCIFYFRGNIILGHHTQPWFRYLSASWEVAAALLLPLFIVLLAGLLVSVEHRATAWKHLYALPVGRATIYTSKFLVLVQLLVLAHVAYVGLLLVSGYLLGLLHPEFGFQHQAVPFGAIARLTARTFVASLGMLGCQYVLSMQSRSFVLPIGVGLACLTTTLPLLRWEHVGWLPFAGPLLTLKSMREAGAELIVPAQLAAHEIGSLLWCAGAFLAGLLLRHRNVG